MTPFDCINRWFFDYKNIPGGVSLIEFMWNISLGGPGLLLVVVKLYFELLIKVRYFVVRY